MSGWGTWPGPGPRPARRRRERIMRDGPMLSCEGPAEEPASAVGAVTDCLPPAFVDCLLDSALEPVLDAAAQRGGQVARRKKNAGDATEVAKALLAVTVCDPACGSGSLLVAAAVGSRDGSRRPARGTSHRTRCGARCARWWSTASTAWT